MLVVKFIYSTGGKIISKEFDSAYRCRLFVERAKRSKKIMLVSYPMSIYQ